MANDMAEDEMKILGQDVSDDELREAVEKFAKCQCPEWEDCLRRALGNCLTPVGDIPEDALYDKLEELTTDLSGLGKGAVGLTAEYALNARDPICVLQQLTRVLLVSVLNCRQRMYAPEWPEIDPY